MPVLRWRGGANSRCGRGDSAYPGRTSSTEASRERGPSWRRQYPVHNALLSPNPLQEDQPCRRARQHCQGWSHNNDPHYCPCTPPPPRPRMSLLPGHPNAPLATPPVQPPVRERLGLGPDTRTLTHIARGDPPKPTPKPALAPRPRYHPYRCGHPHPTAIPHRSRPVRTALSFQLVLRFELGTLITIALEISIRHYTPIFIRPDGIQVCLPVPRRWVNAHIRSLCPSTNSNYDYRRLAFTAEITTTRGKKKEWSNVHIHKQNHLNTVHHVLNGVVHLGHCVCTFSS